jgi:capsule polysaccharide export protein KpsC/LpsZ
MSFSLYRDTIASYGIAKDDAEVIADCMATKRLCSWVNTEPVTNEQVKKINELIVQHNIPIFVVVDSVPTRSKYIWEVKHKKQ